MKLVLITLAMLALLGCSNAPTKLERIEANEKAIVNLQSQIDVNSKRIDVNTRMNGNMNTKIDRMFEKSMYK